MKPKLTFVVIAFIASACAITKTLPPQDIAHADPEATSLVISYSLHTEDPLYQKDGCTLYLQNLQTLKSYDAKLMPGESTVLLNPAPGSYRIDQLYCSRHRNWISAVRTRLPPFVVLDGHLNYLAPMEFFITDSTGYITIRTKNRFETRTRLTKLFGRLPEPARANVVSAFNGKLITAKMLDEEGRFRWEAKAPGKGKTILQGNNKIPSFGPCYDGEWETNRVWMGSPKFAVKYEKGEFVTVAPVLTEHTFSDVFLRCAQTVMKEFHPSDKRPLEYTFNF